MKYCLLCLSVCLMMSCKQAAPSNPPVEEIVEIPEDFVPFYQAFHSDSLYQMEHILFPLKGQSDSTQWSQADWVMHHPIDNSSGEFRRSLDNFQGIIIETITHDKGLFNMVRRFAKLGDDWHLIYYNVKTISFGSDGE